ncbi:GRAM domain-containing protein 4 isoform X2 [Triplophysa dalaica]|uniref:GRAM domain-containing protein 4 isoform X2 n=1 Tax=Triplophysa dalaica TaxID=1582913 RepID=UPI0024DFBF4D|nr:GRAM domain-containing protein 4 isoform X2 [Triplophysa dalaica]
MKLCYDLRAGATIHNVKVKPKAAVLNMLKRLDKIRFRGPKRDDFLDQPESPTGSDTECSDEILLRPRPSIRDNDEQRDPVLATWISNDRVLSNTTPRFLADDEDFMGHPSIVKQYSWLLRIAVFGPAGSGTLAVMQDLRSESERLNEVKGHLEIALLEKHFLQEELRKLREETNVETIKQELERERSRRLDLEQRMSEVLKTRCEDSPPQPPHKQQPPAANGTDKQQKETVCYRLQNWLYDRFGVYIEDFRFQPEENTVEAEEPLSAKRLTENMRRLKRGARPVTNFLRNLSALSNWHSVYTSAIAFIIYMNAAWHGWAIPLFLSLAILRLSLNYLIARGWRIQWSIVPEVSEPVVGYFFPKIRFRYMTFLFVSFFNTLLFFSCDFQEPPKEDLTVSEKFQLVLDVAQKAQNLFGKMADVLEKIKNLFMWVQPEITQKLYIALWVAFITSCVLPYKLMGFMIGLYAGIKFFIIDFLFKSCPKLRDKYDTPFIMWNSLPTDPQLKERSNATVLRRIQPVVSRSSLATVPAGVTREEESSRSHSTKKGAFHEIFNLPENERPLPVCENGWRCCLINRDRKMPTDYIRNGMLYVTENYLCFESSSSKSGSSKKNKVIKLVDITDIQKYKVLSVLPGSGMGISIATPSTQKPLVFGAMIHRDEAFETIFTQYMKIMTTSNPET